jgi:hypothetical protein
VIWISIFISTAGYRRNQSDFIRVDKPRTGIGILAVASQAGGLLKGREFRSGYDEVPPNPGGINFAVDFQLELRRTNGVFDLGKQ